MPSQFQFPSLEQRLQQLGSPPAQVYLMDEVTTDLDVITRDALLKVPPVERCATLKNNASPGKGVAPLQHLSSTCPATWQVLKAESQVRGVTIL